MTAMNFPGQYHLPCKFTGSLPLLVVSRPFFSHIGCGKDLLDGLNDAGGESRLGLELAARTQAAAS